MKYGIAGLWAVIFGGLAWFSFAHGDAVGGACDVVGGLAVIALWLWWWNERGDAGEVDMPDREYKHES